MNPGTFVQRGYHYLAMLVVVVAALLLLAFEYQVASERLAQYEYVFGGYWEVFEGTEGMSPQEARSAILLRYSDVGSGGLFSWRTSGSANWTAAGAP